MICSYKIKIIERLKEEGENFFKKKMKWMKYREEEEEERQHIIFLWRKKGRCLRSNLKKASIIYLFICLFIYLFVIN